MSHAVFYWRNPINALKYLAEIQRIFIATALLTSETGSSVSDSSSQAFSIRFEVRYLMGESPVLLLEQMGKVMLADINRFRKGIQRDERRKILIQIFLDFLTLLAESRLVLPD